MTSLLQEIADYFDQNGSFVRATIIAAEGSTPRGVGAAIMVSREGISGTIGGGALEFNAIKHAREQLEIAKELWRREEKQYPLGPRLGQCCGGHVRLLFERFEKEEITFIRTQLTDGARYVSRSLQSGASIQLREDGAAGLLKTELGEALIEFNERQRLAIYLYGAGHVGREIVRVLGGVAADIVWIDTDEGRFPPETAENVKRLITTEPHLAVAYAPDNAFHLVMTYSHPMDLEICHSVLKHGRFRYLGLIGSATKRARFVKRLAELGVNEQGIERLICPIGSAGPPGKEPAVIAISTAVEILTLAQVGDDEKEPDNGS